MNLFSGKKCKKALIPEYEKILVVEVLESLISLKILTPVRSLEEKKETKFF